MKSLLLCIIVYYCVLCCSVDCAPLRLYCVHIIVCMFPHSVMTQELTFSASVSSQNVTVMVNLDDVVEGDEVVSLSLSTTDTAITLDPDTANITVSDGSESLTQ